MNYMKKILEKAQFIKIEKGKIYHNIIKHDDWCNSYKTGINQDCDCDPDVEIITDEEYQRRVHDK